MGAEIIEMEVKERILRDSIVDGIMSLIVSIKETRERHLTVHLTNI